MSAPTKITADTAKLPLMLTALRLPTFANLWPAFADRADREGWPAARFLAALAELELAERDRRRIQRHLREARLPMGKTLESFDFAAVPTLSKAHVMALAEGDSWLAKGNNILAFGPPGGGKSHLAAALGHALIHKGYRVLFTRTTDLVRRLQTARQNLTLAQDVAKLDKFHLLILDDLSYVQKDHAETSVLFELIAARYERRSIMITANQPFGGWDGIFPDKAMTVAAIDRLVHHAVIFEMNVESYRRRAALERATTSSPAAASSAPPSSPPTGPSPSGPRPSPTPPVSSLSSTVSSTTPKSSPSTAIPIAARRPRSARSSAAQSAAAGVQQVDDQPGRTTLQTPGCSRPRSRGSSQSMERAPAGAKPARLSPQKDRPIPRPTTPSCTTSANMRTSRPSLTPAAARPQSHRMALRLPLSHRDLCAGEKAPIRLLRLPAAGGRPTGRADRHAPPGGPPVRAGALARARRAPRQGAAGAHRTRTRPHRPLLRLRRPVFEKGWIRESRE